MSLCQLLEGDSEKGFKDTLKKSEETGIPESFNLSFKLYQLQNLLIGEINEVSKKKIKSLISEISMDLPSNAAKLLGMYGNKQMEREAISESTTGDMK